MRHLAYGREQNESGGRDPDAETRNLDTLKNPEDPRAPALPLPVLVLGLAVLLALIVKLCGAEPREALYALVRGAGGSAEAWGVTLARAAVLALSGLAIALSFRAGLFNIGAEGQFLLGALAAAAVGTKILPQGVPGFVGVPVLLLAGAAGGAAWSLLAGVLREWRGISEVISTLMLNLLAAILIKYLVSYKVFLQDPDPLTNEPKSAYLPDGAQLAGWGGTAFHAGVFIILPAAALLYVLIHHTRAGLALRATGLNESAARACGIPVARVRLLVFFFSGALAGLGGAMAMLADGRLGSALYPEYGYMAIAVALVAGLHPLGVLPAALFFALLESGAKAMERDAAVPSQVVFLVQGLVILALLMRGVHLPGQRRATGAAAEVGRES